MRAFLLAILIGLVATSGACRPEQPTQTTGSGNVQANAPTSGESAARPPVPENVARAAAIARELQREPGRAMAIMQSHGVSIPEFEALMYEIAADPELSSAYARELESPSP